MRFDRLRLEKTCDVISWTEPLFLVCKDNSMFHQSTNQKKICIHWRQTPPPGPTKLLPFTPSTQLKTTTMSTFDTKNFYVFQLYAAPEVKLCIQLAECDSSILANQIVRPLVIYVSSQGWWYLTVSFPFLNLPHFVHIAISMVLYPFSWIHLCLSAARIYPLLKTQLQPLSFCLKPIICEQ